MSQSQYNDNQTSESLGDRKRRQLFALYSNNLNVVKQHPLIRLEPDEEEGFVCPICFKFFTREALSKSYDDHLTLEDVPPISLGGKVRTLTCKVCNNWAGSQLESHLKRKLNMDEFFQGVVSSWDSARFRPHPDINLPATVHIQGESGIYIEYHPGRSHPEDIEKLRELEASENIPGIKVDFVGKYKKHRPEVALLRIAYLWAFGFFGYGFLISFNIQRIRHQIRNPTERILPNWVIANADFPDEALGINVITEPKELQSFIVVFELKTANRTTRHGVILPGPSEPGLKVYDWLSSATNIERELKFRTYNIPEYNYIVDPNLAFASHQIWHELKSPS